jgi:quinohemoprotein amine dehydrogenase
MVKRIALVVIAALWTGVVPARAQTTPTGAVAAPEGFAIDSELVRSRCGSCHRTDDKGRMSRISFRRATPENWERTVKRMMALNHVRLEAADARSIVKYLADRQGLAPEELRPIQFEEERRTVDFPYTADETTANLCSSCHSIARVLSERRTKEEWELLIAMHRGYYPLVDNQPMNGPMGFRRARPPQADDAVDARTADARPPDNRQPMERAIEHVSKTLPLDTSEWAAWSAAMQPPKLAGRWAVSGSQTGKGAIYGVMTIAADPGAPDTFTTDVRYTVARTGETVTRTGKALVYTGFQWRGRADDWREVMFVERNWKDMWGRWFTGAYDETGLDVKLTRLGTEPIVLGTSVSSLKTGSSGQSVKIFGANLPQTVAASDIGVGRGVKVARVVTARSDEVDIEVDIASDAPIGARDVSVAGTVKPGALVVYDRIDAIKVVPLSGMARVGGAVFPKQLQQFEAIAIQNGPDGKADTADDLNLGVVDVKWSLEEYPTTFNDDDTQFVGAIDQKGLFTPNLDGPNPKRSGNRNNVGDVWVVAELAPTTGAQAPTARPLRARAHLLVTVPLYMNWFAEESK